MKGSCTLVASVLAASTVAISSTSYASSSAEPDVTFHLPSTEGLGYSSSTEKLRSGNSRKLLLTSEKEKFTPRFDGLRFIETLVTAHRSLFVIWLKLYGDEKLYISYKRLRSLSIVVQISVALSVAMMGYLVHNLNKKLP